jgi:membrane-associated phospholipid phosphatase
VIFPPGLRAPAAAVAVLALLVFGVFAARYADSSSAGRIDRHVQLLVGHEPSLTESVIVFGSPAAVVVLALFLAVVPLTLGHRRLAVLAVVGPGLTGVATTTLKPIVGRTLDGSFAFPSGHTGGATALGLVTALLLVTVLSTATGTSAILIAAGAMLSGGAMALALVADRAHYATDTVGGFCVAVTVVLTSALAIERWPRRRHSPEGLPRSGP